MMSFADPAKSPVSNHVSKIDRVELKYVYKGLPTNHRTTPCDRKLPLQRFFLPVSKDRISTTSKTTLQTILPSLFCKKLFLLRENTLETSFILLRFQKLLLRFPRETYIITVQHDKRDCFCRDATCIKSCRKYTE